MLEDRFPTLVSLGLGPQLAAMEALCTREAGKHAGSTIQSKGADHHYGKADSHMTRAGYGYCELDESGELHLIHAAVRLLMAAACAIEEQR